jgi:hypothetical protein
VRVAYLSHARVLMIKQVNIPMIVAVQYYIFNTNRSQHMALKILVLASYRNNNVAGLKIPTPLCKLDLRPQYRYIQIIEKNMQIRFH